MSIPTWPAWEIGVAGLALAGVSLAAARGIGAARARWGALAGRVDDLASRLRAVEARADMAEGATASSPRGRRASRRAGGDLADPPRPAPAGSVAMRGSAGASPSRNAMAESSRRESRPGPRPPGSEPTAPPLILVPSLEATGSPEAADEAVAGLGRRFGAIWAMADAGEAPPAIARATGHPVGQVELILGLRRPAPIGEPDADA